jgi:hypothetical protein
MSRRLFNDRSYRDRDSQGRGRRDGPSVTVTVASIQGGTVLYVQIDIDPLGVLFLSQGWRHSNIILTGNFEHKFM